ncbi:MFS transporter [Streptomyces purpurascens]|uniref:MFS transporter n=1 Tax=Streptomyces purpurascens TaxID=1924 RepID=UPI00167670AA|nr:MFS transporter [Streptomyces purpurascens]MCE7045519.1 MFS transporter [Streptomyces purpurascens]GHA07058.1 MFS transporter [Streptomyces purpurascens]
MALPKAFWLLWFGQTVSRLGTLAPAFLVLYMEQDGLVAPGTTPLIVGLFGAGVVLSGLVGGAVADLIGPRRTIVAAQPVTAAMALLFAVAENVVALCALSLITGFLSSVDRPAGAGLISAIVPQEQFSKAYSLFLVGFNIGMSLSPVFSGFLLEVSPGALFVVWAASSLVYAALVFAVPADPPPAQGADRPAGAAAALKAAARGIAEPFRTPVLVAFLLLTFLLACIYLQVNSALPLDMRASGLSTGDIGFVLAVNAVLSVLLLPLVPRLVGGLRAHVPLILAAVFMALGFGGNALAGGMVSFTVATVVWTLGEVLWAPMSATFIADRAPAGRSGTYQGSYFFAWNAAFVVGSPAGLALAHSHGYGALWMSVLGLGLVVTAGFTLLPRLAGFVTKPGPGPDSDSDPGLDTESVTTARATTPEPLTRETR